MKSRTKATQRRNRFAFFPCPDDGTKSLHQEQKTESGTISFLQLGQFIRTSGSGEESKRRYRLNQKKKNRPCGFSPTQPVSRFAPPEALASHDDIAPRGSQHLSAFQCAAGTGA